MKWRKILAAGMGLVMAAGLMSGCGGQTKEADNNKKDSQEKAMGRYVEEDLKPLWGHMKRMEPSGCILPAEMRKQV